MGWSGEGNDTPLQSSCLENPMDGGGWWAAVHGVAKSQTQLSDFPFTFHFHALEKKMATHSSVLAWRIPGTGKPGGLPSMGLHRVGHDWGDLAAAAAAMEWSIWWWRRRKVKTEAVSHHQGGWGASQESQKVSTWGWWFLEEPRSPCSPCRMVALTGGSPSLCLQLLSHNKRSCGCWRGRVVTAGMGPSCQQRSSSERPRSQRSRTDLHWNVCVAWGWLKEAGSWDMEVSGPMGHVLFSDRATW